MPDPTAPASPALPDAEMSTAATLLATQTLLYLTFPHLVQPWEFHVMTAAAVGVAAMLLWTTRHRVRRSLSHVINGMVWADTVVEGVLQAQLLPAYKPVRHNLYCVAAFALVYIIWNAWPRSGRDD